MEKYAWKFKGTNGRIKVSSPFSSKKKAVGDLKKIKEHEVRTFGKIMPLTKSIKVVKLEKK